MIRDNALLVWAACLLLVALYMYVHGVPTGEWLP
jgi:hypothetical protein